MSIDNSTGNDISSANDTKHIDKRRRVLPFKPKLAEQRKLWATPIFDTSSDTDHNNSLNPSKYQQIHTDLCGCGYNSSENILIVGDGDLSFTLAMLKHLHSTEHHNVTHTTCCTQCQPGTQPLIVCSTYESYEELCKRYGKANDNIQGIKQYNNVIVLHSIDATNLADTLSVQLSNNDSTLYKQACNIMFNRIVFNFPHTGGKMMLGKNRALIQSFLYSIRQNTLSTVNKQYNDTNKLKLICGEHSFVHIALARGQGGTPSDTELREHGNNWQLTNCAAMSGFVLYELYPFNTNLFSKLGYNSKGYRSVDSGFHNHLSLTHVLKMVDDNNTLSCFNDVLDVDTVDINHYTELYVKAVQQHDYTVQHNVTNRITNDTIPPNIRCLQSTNSNSNHSILHTAADRLTAYITSRYSQITNLRTDEQTTSIDNVESLHSICYIKQLYKTSVNTALLPHILASTSVQQALKLNQSFITSATTVYNQLKSYDLVSMTTPHTLNYTFVVNSKHPVVNYLPEKLWSTEPRYNDDHETLNKIQQSTTYNVPATGFVNLQYPVLHQLMFTMNEIDAAQFNDTVHSMLSTVIGIDTAHISIQAGVARDVLLNDVHLTIDQHIIIQHSNQLQFPSQHNSVAVGQIGQTSTSTYVCILVMEPITMLLYNIIDLRSFYTSTNTLLQQPNNPTTINKHISTLYNTVYIRDNSLLVNDDTFDEYKFISIALLVAGPCLIRINLLDVYQHETQGTARTYRFLYHAAPTTAIAHTHIRKIQQILFQTLSKLGIVSLRESDAKPVQ